MSLEPQPEPQAGIAARNRAPLVSSEERLSMMDLWRVLMKQRFIILTAILLTFAASVYYAFRTPPLYESVARIEIQPNSPSNIGLQSIVAEEQGGQNASDLQTEVRVLQSDSVLFQTAQSLNLMSRLSPPAGKMGRAGTPAPSHSGSRQPVRN